MSTPTRRPLLRRIALIGGIAMGSLLLLAIATYLFLPAHYLDGYIERRIIGALEEAYPAYTVRIDGLHYSVLENRLECDSVHIIAADSAETFSISHFTLTGIAGFQVLFRGHLTPDHIAGCHVEVRGLAITIVNSRYELRCARARLSVPDSVLDIELLEFKPPMGDEKFFGLDKYRSTRFQLVIPECRVTGLASLGLIQGTEYLARTALLTNPTLSVLINKEKPSDLISPPPDMPNEILSSLKEPLRIDSIRIRNGRLIYGERFGAGAEPGVLTCENMQILVAGIGNTNPQRDTAVVLAEGVFMDGGMMTVQMAVPLSDSGLTYRYSGAVSRMNASAFNSFIERSEQKRLKTGILHSASFDVDVKKGRAKGSIRMAYEDIKIVAIDLRSGSESGVGNTLLSFFANNIKLRTSNMPDKSGAMKIGTVEYAKQRGEAFMEFTWLSLRTGICDVVGF